MPKTLFVLGCGLVGSTLLEFFCNETIGQRVRGQFDRLVVIDQDNKQAVATAAGAHFLRLCVTPATIGHVFALVRKGDFLFDVSYNISTAALVEHCLRVGAHYVNTSVERWPLHQEETLGDDASLRQRSLWFQHASLKALADNLQGDPSSCALVTHGMNPGLITHCARMALLEIARDTVRRARDNNLCASVELDSLKDALQDRDYAALAFLLGVRAVHCSEVDTQKPKKARQPGEFVNTWGPYSFYSESVDPVQVGWGTHEGASSLGLRLEDNHMLVRMRGVDAVAESFVPTVGAMKGALISHSENETLCRSLTLRDPSGKVAYAPSCYYVYQASPAALESLQAVKASGYRWECVPRPLQLPDIESGFDAVGSLILMDRDPLERMTPKPSSSSSSDRRSFWCGSILSVEQASQMNFTSSGPTTIQVAISLLVAADLILAGKVKPGLLFPEDMPSEQIVRRCQPYLGEFVCEFVAYSASTQLNVQLQ